MRILVSTRLFKEGFSELMKHFEVVFQINFLKKYDDFEEDFKTHIDFIIENTNKLL